MERSAEARERGVVLPLVAATIAVLMTMTAFTIDVGRVLLRNREMQAIADVAAIDAAHELDGRTQAALQPVVEAVVAETATRNGEEGADFVVQLGTYDVVSRDFTASPTPTSVPNAVRVNPTDPVDFIFAPGESLADRDAVAVQGQVVPNPCTATTLGCLPPCPVGSPGCPTDPGTTTTTLPGTPTSLCLQVSCLPGVQQSPPLGAFTIGSYLASVNTAQAGILNTVLSTLFTTGSPAAAIDFVSWRGLGNARVTADDLAAALGLGSPTELAAADVTAYDLVDAFITVLNANGDPTNAATLNGILARVDTTRTVDLGQLLHVATGSDGAARTADLQVARLLTGAAFIADGDHAVGVPAFAAGIPGITTTSIGLTVIEAPVFVSGPVDTTTAGSTRQVAATLGNTVSIGLPPIAGVTSATLAGSLTIALEGAGAEGRLAAVSCTGVQGIAVDAESTAVDVTFTLTATLTVQVGVITVNEPIVITGTATTNPATGLLDFVHPTEFDLDPYSYGPERIGSHTLGLQTIGLTVTDGIGSPLLGGVTGALLTSLTATVLPGLLSGVDNNVVSPISQTLGLGLGGADVWANQRVCYPPTLVP